MYTILIVPATCEVGVMIPILQLRYLGLKEVESFWELLFR